MAEKKLSAIPIHRDMIGYKIVSVPSGHKYGKDGHVPCNHHIEFDYPDCTRHFDGQTWTVQAKE